uniref:ER membrane protein complex subunit 4 n=1 Tax=Magallana gigas TaxID=29159 RepID=K1PIC5_MAGGI
MSSKRKLHKWSIDFSGHGRSKSDRQVQVQDIRAPVGYTESTGTIVEQSGKEADQKLIDKASISKSTFVMIEGSQAIIQKFIYIFGNFVCLMLAMYKCQTMGLLPTHASDWLAFMDPQKRMEWSGVPVYKKIHVPIVKKIPVIRTVIVREKIPKPFEVPVVKHVPVPRHVPVIYEVPVDRPFPVEKKVIVEKPVPVTKEVPVPAPFPVFPKEKVGKPADGGTVVVDAGKGGGKFNDFGIPLGGKNVDVGIDPGIGKDIGDRFAGFELNGNGFPDSGFGDFSSFDARLNAIAQGQGGLVSSGGAIGQGISATDLGLPSGDLGLAGGRFGLDGIDAGDRFGRERFGGLPNLVGGGVPGEAGAKLATKG